MKHLVSQLLQPMLRAESLAPDVKYGKRTEIPPCPAVDQEVELIKCEVRAVLKKVFELGNGDIARGTVLAFEAGVLDIPFAPSVCNAGKILPVRDNTGAIRLLEAGCVPLPQDILALHHDYVAERARAEGRGPSFQMVIDDINAVSTVN